MGLIHTLNTGYFPILQCHVFEKIVTVSDRNIPPINFFLYFSFIAKNVVPIAVMEIILIALQLLLDDNSIGMGLLVPQSDYSQ